MSVKAKVANCIAARGTDNRVRHAGGNDRQECRSYARRGLSLTEVLISMGILTVGLLGVVSVFPVGSFYMKKAEISDRGSALAQSVMNDLMTRGMLNPRSWYVMVPPNAGTPANAAFPSDGKYAPSPPASKLASFTRPFAQTLSEALNQNNAATDSTLIGKQFGSAFVIDPMGIAAMGFPSLPPSPWRNGPAAVFPAAAYSSFTSYYAQPWSTSIWSPWCGAAEGKNGVWPVRRVTFRQMGTASPTDTKTGWRMDFKTAEHYFRGNDDLAMEIPSRDDRPGQQLWDTTTNATGAQIPLARQTNGDYSWIVTVVPTTNAARDGMARNPEGFSYDVTVVVFYKRVLPTDAASVTTSNPAQGDYYNAMGEGERAVKAKILSTGLNGGEILLTDLQDAYPTTNDPNNATLYPNKSPFKQLKIGEWVMLCGPHPNSNVVATGSLTKGEPRFALNWYQVVAIDKEGAGVTGFDSRVQRVVALRGPEWPWKPTDALADGLCVAICKGAVAVHTKTMRLEGHGTAWSVSAGSGGGDMPFGGAGM